VIRDGARATHAPEPATAPHAERLRQVSAMVARHDAQLHRVVRRRGSQSPGIVDDACRYAWIQLLIAEHVDLRPPLWEALGWLTTCAVRYARMLEEAERDLTATDALAGATQS
jgi:hypothetical protein